MIPILIITHGTLAESLTESLSMIYGQTKEIYAFNFTQDMEVSMLFEKVEQKTASLQKPVLIFTDMLGGSAFNTAMKIQQKFDVHIIAGVNLMLLLDIVSVRGSMDFNTLKKHINENKEKYISIFEKKEN